VVFLKQGANLLLLFRSQLQISGKASKFLVYRLWGVDMLKLLTRRGLLYSTVLSYGRRGYSENEHNRVCKNEGSISHGQQPH
jgi:hypothetical protein